LGFTQSRFFFKKTHIYLINKVEMKLISLFHLNQNLKCISETTNLKGRNLKHLRTLRFLSICLGLYMMPLLGVAQPTITHTTSPFLELDSNMPGVQGPTAAYVGFKINNTTPSTYVGLTATLTLTGAGFSLAGGQVATQEVGISGTLVPGEVEALYWFVQYPATHNVPVTATVQLSDANGPVGSPFSVVITTRSTISANAGGLVASTIVGPGIYVGQIFYYDVSYTFGNIKSGDYVNMQPVGNPAFNAGCYQLIDAEILSSMVPGITAGNRDQIYYTASANKNGSGIPVSVRYHFFVKCANVGASQALPYATTLSGNQYKYSGNYGLPVNLPDPQPSIAISKSVTPNNIPDPAMTLPDDVTYTVMVTNTSPLPVSFQKITDILPSPFTYVSLAPGSQVTASNSSSLPMTGASGTLMFISDDLPADATVMADYFLPVGGSIMLKYVANIPVTTPHPAAYTNIATATSGNYTTPPANAVVTLGNLQVADLSITKAVSYPTPNYGETVTYTLTVSNAGADPATNVQILDSIPNGIMLISSMPAFSTSVVDGNFTKYFWNGLSVPVNGSVTITYTAKAVQGAGNTFKNYAEINAASQPDPDANHAIGFNADDLNDGIADDDEACVVLMPCEPITYMSNQITVVNACPGQAITVQLTGLPSGFVGPATFAYEITPTGGTSFTGTTGLITVNAGVATFFVPGLSPGTYELETLTVFESTGCRNTIGGLNVMFNVGDTQPPTISCPSNTTVNCIAAIPPIDFDEVVANDNCQMAATVLLSANQTPGACSNRYTITRVFQATDGVNLTATCSQTIMVDDHDVFGGSNDQTICGAETGELSAMATCNTDNDIRFVRFTSPQTDPYTAVGGTLLGVATPMGASSPYTASLPWAPSSWTVQGLYYVYAILDDDQGVGCRPFEEIIITVGPPATLTLSSNTAPICAGASFDLASLIVSFSGGTLSYHATAADAANYQNLLPSSSVSPAEATNYFIRSGPSFISTCAVIEKVTITIAAPSCGTIQVTGPN
jgi:uncharacterized repeat protein (TIGR01451 family)